MDKLKQVTNREFSSTEFQEALLAVHLRKICVSLLYALGFFTIFYLLVVGEAGRYLFPVEEWTLFTLWRWTVSFLMAWMIVAITVSRVMRRNYHCAFTFTYLPAAFFTGFYLSQVTYPGYAVSYIIYLVPLFTLVLPGGFRERTLATVGSFLIVPGIYLARGFDPYYFLAVSLVLGSCVLISVLVGHFAVYRMNRINFFRSRTMEKQKSRIEELARFDQLTGLYERHELEKRLESEYNRARREERNFSVLMVDLDHFKEINDTYGHAVGDDVLEEFGEIINEITENQLRSSDVAGRYGGEEFCIILPTAGPGSARSVANRIREELKGTEFESETGETFRVTCSIGAAELTPDVHDPEELVKRADRALYEAKETGRDQVLVYSTLEE